MFLESESTPDSRDGVRIGVLLVAGLAAHRDHLRPLSRAIGEHRPCSLASPAASHREVCEVADAVAAELPAPVVLVGFSEGFRVALEIQRRHRSHVAGLVALAGAATPSCRGLGRERPGAAVRTLVRAARGGAATKAPGMGLAVGLIRAAAQDLRRLRSYRYHWAADTLPAIDIPLLVIAGEQDRSVPLALMRAMAFAVRGSQWDVILGAGHDLALRHVGCVAAKVDRFAGTFDV